jgi:hypothetical protein
MKTARALITVLVVCAGAWVARPIAERAWFVYSSAAGPYMPGIGTFKRRR